MMYVMTRRVLWMFVVALVAVVAWMAMRGEDDPVRATPWPPGASAVTFTSDGATLAGELTIPRGPGPHPGVVLLAGFGPFTRDGAGLIASWSEELVARGIATLRYDKRGLGDSAGRADDWLDPRVLTDDARAAARWLGEQPGISSVSLMGHSQGGDIALAAGNDARRVITAGAPGRSIAELGDEGRLDLVPRRDVRSAILRANPAADARALERPLLLIHGTADQVVPVADAQILRRARPAGQVTRVLLLPGAGHSAPTPDDRATWNTVARFVRAAG